MEDEAGGRGCHVRLGRLDQPVLQRQVWHAAELCIDGDQSGAQCEGVGGDGEEGSGGEISAMTGGVMRRTQRETLREGLREALQERHSERGSLRETLRERQSERDN